LEGARSGNIEREIARPEALHGRLWSEAAALREKTPGPGFAGDFIQPLSEIIAQHTRRMVVGLEFHIPNILWIVLYAIMSLAAASIGYHTGLTGRGRPLVVLAFILSFSAVMFLIEDLDRPLQGFLKSNQQAFVDLQRTMSDTRH